MELTITFVIVFALSVQIVIILFFSFLKALKFVRKVSLNPTLDLFQKYIYCSSSFPKPSWRYVNE